MTKEEMDYIMQYCTTQLEQRPEYLISEDIKDDLLKISQNISQVEKSNKSKKNNYK